MIFSKKDPAAHPLSLLLLAAAVVWLIPRTGESQDVSVDAALLSDRIAIGETGTLRIRATNGEPDAMPQQIDAPGLTITRAQSQYSQTLDSTGRSVSEYLFYYQIVGRKEGKFTIPVQTVRVRNQNLTTAPVEITVYTPKAGDEILDAKRPYFSRLTLDATEFYAGQMIPAQLKVYVRGGNSIHDLGRPKLTHDEIVVQGFTQAETDVVQLDGIPFSTAMLDGSLFVLSPGNYTIGPAGVDVRMMESSRFGSIGYFQSTKVRPLQSNPVPVTVKPLPEIGKPDTFRGAIGSFQMTVTAKPKTLKVGDPISLEFEVTGLGNLDSVEAPVFLAADPDGWRSYDARKIVDPSEESDGRKSGRATFSQIVMPRTEVSEIPPFELAFFNPKTGQYDTRRTDPIPISVAADDMARGPGSAAMPVGGPGGSFSRPAAASPEAAFDSPLFINLETPKWHVAAVPASTLSRPGFWIAQALPSIALFTILGVGLTRVVRNRAARRQQDQNRVSFQNAMAGIGDATDRGEHYHAVQNALAAWQQESKTPAEKLPGAANSGFQALQSRCQWILYGAADAEQERAITGQEAAENRQILDALAGFLR